MDRKQELIEKFFSVYRNFGFKDITLDDLALKFGISKKTIYKYFGNREHVIHCVADYFLVSVKSEIDKHCQQDSSPLKQLLDVICVTIRSLLGIRPIFFISLSRGHRRQYLALLDFRTNYFSGILYDLLIDARDDGFLSESAPIHSFVAAHNNLLSTFAEGKKKDEFLPGMTSESYFLFVVSTLGGMATPKGKDQLESILGNFDYSFVERQRGTQA
ncbi:MAG: TetR/AcrR family transcriptional regulator [Cytophagales bacterium]|nr:TetR/AcrR family transcriptional regulator [Cytophagales bacterium]